MRLSTEVCREARALIARRLGLDFPEARQADLERGVRRACLVSSVPDPEAYLARLAALRHESPEWRRVRLLLPGLDVRLAWPLRDRAASNRASDA